MVVLTFQVLVTLPAPMPNDNVTADVELAVSIYTEMTKKH
jgi:hypothetical protein